MCANVCWWSSNRVGKENCSICFLLSFLSNNVRVLTKYFGEGKRRVSERERERGGGGGVYLSEGKESERKRDIHGSTITDQNMKDEKRKKRLTGTRKICGETETKDPLSYITVVRGIFEGFLQPLIMKFASGAHIVEAEWCTQLYWQYTMVERTTTKLKSENLDREETTQYRAMGTL